MSIHFNNFGLPSTSIQLVIRSVINSLHKCDQIRRKLRIWSHFLKKSLMKNFIFCVVVIVRIQSLTVQFWLRRLHNLQLTRKTVSHQSSLLIFETKPIHIDVKSPLRNFKEKRNRKTLFAFVFYGASFFFYLRVN